MNLTSELLVVCMFRCKHNAKYYVISKLKDCCTVKAEKVAQRKCHGSHSTFIGKCHVD